MTGPAAQNNRAGAAALPVVGLLGLGSAIFVTHAPLGATALLALAVLVAAGLGFSGLSDGKRRLAAALAAAAIAAVALSFLPWSSSLLLTLLLGAAGWLKLAERNGPRDRFVAALAGLWLLAVGLLRLSPNAALACIAVALSCLIWMLARDGAGQNAAGKGRAVALSVGPAVILTVILFIFTPRITGDLGHLAFALDLPFVIETQAEQQRKPQSNGMSLDDLDQNSDGDMRVLVGKFYKGSGVFEDGLPNLGDMYWRGPVLWTYDAGQWAGRPGWDSRTTRMRTKLRKASHKRMVREKGKRALYDVSLFPHRGEWLYALDLPAYAPASAYITRDWQLMNLNPVREMLNYPMMSFLDYRAGFPPDDETLAMALQIPQGQEPRILALGRELRAKAGDDPVAIAHAGLNLFNDGFSYDRSAPTGIENNPVDRFFFDDKLGFGMQFASAYTLAMRAAGVPTRLVAGYRGGLNVGLTDMVLVLQKDAHAWAEVWIEEYGWVRMDPSARTVSRQRKEGADGWGLASGLGAEAEQAHDDDDDDDDGEEDSQDDAGGSEGAPPPGPLTDLPESGHWLTGFDAGAQGRMLSAGNMRANWSWLVLSGVAMLALCAGAALMLRWGLRRLRQRARPVSERLTGLVVQLLARHGIRRRPGEGLRSLAARARATPDLPEGHAQALAQLALWLCRLKYGLAPAPIPEAARRFPGFDKRVRQLVD